MLAVAATSQQPRQRIARSRQDRYLFAGRPSTHQLFARQECSAQVTFPIDHVLVSGHVGPAAKRPDLADPPRVVEGGQPAEPLPVIHRFVQDRSSAIPSPGLHETIAQAFADNRELARDHRVIRSLHGDSKDLASYLFQDSKESLLIEAFGQQRICRTPFDNLTQHLARRP